jgi:hypothetical protein
MSRSSPLADRIAKAVKGQVHGCRASFGRLGQARECVKGSYGPMTTEVYVFPPYFEVWIQNFRLASEATLSVNEPSPVMGLWEPLAKAFRGVAAPVFTMKDADLQAVRAFCGDPGNEADIAALGLQSGESLTVSPRQITLRGKTDDEDLIRARFEALRRIFERNGGGGQEGVLIAERVLAIGDTVERDAGRREVRHRFGGDPDPAIVCRNCRKPAHRLLSLDTEDPLLARLKLWDRFLPIVHCLTCQVISSPFAIQYLRGSWTIVEQAANRDFADFPGRFDERQVELREPRRTTAESAGDRKKHKVGGAPEWIQAAEQPDCPACKRPMSFLAQLETEPALGVQFGDDGMLFGFVCVECRVVTTLIQSL